MKYVLALVAAAALGMSACTPAQEEEAAATTEEAGDALGEAADSVGEAASEAGEAVEGAVNDAATEVEHATDDNAATH